MQFKLLTTVALATLAVAVPTDPPPTDQCNAPNNLECCNSVQAPTNSGLIGTLLGLLNISVGDITGLVGLTCNPISLIGGGNSWYAISFLEHSRAVTDSAHQQRPNCLLPEQLLR
ncbi:CoH2 [Coprinopsis cinerea AmutBmut pab1-1]|nr:CoH2 [Coprinopsis cinerea AmutBmut pab1-1]